MSALSEITLFFSLFEDDPDYRNEDDEMSDMLDGSHCSDGWYREGEPEYSDDRIC